MCTFLRSAEENEDLQVFSFHDPLMLLHVMHLSVAQREKGT